MNVDSPFWKWKMENQKASDKFLTAQVDKILVL